MSKKTLSEHQVRRFQKLAEISSINEMEAETTDEAEELEEGGAAARVGNEDRDVGRDRMTADRIREEEEVSEGEETIEEVDLGDVAKGAFRGAKTAAKGGLALGPAGALAAAPLGAMAGGAKSVADQVTGKGATPAPAPDTRTSPNPDTRTSKYVPELDNVSMNESQMRELIGRIKARIMQENRKVQGMTRNAYREQQVRLVEAKMIQNIERNRAIHHREALTEALVGRVVNRLKELKK